jgi:hypothetical protein
MLNAEFWMFDLNSALEAVANMNESCPCGSKMHWSVRLHQVS